MRPSSVFVYLLLSAALPAQFYPATAQAEAPPAPAVVAGAAALAITSIDPNPAKPGDTLTIRGSNFGAVPGVLKIGSETITVPASRWADGSIEATVPDMARGAANVSITVGGNSGSSTLNINVPIIEIALTPKAIQPANGKLPATMTLAIYEKKCDDTQGTDLAQGPGAPYTVLITGAGLMLSSLRASKCSISGSLAIDPNSSGSYTVLLYDKQNNLVGTADMGVLDSGAGPIPPGVNPEVDVMWEVMSQRNCSDVFGKRVSQRLYCIQLKIGNNSGHPIQLAGIGFTNKLNALKALGAGDVTIANSSYASTRAVLLQSQVWSNRNIIANSLQGAGLIMAASNPFFTNTSQLTPKLHFQTVTNIVGSAALQAFNIIVPDPVVPQLKSLDDQSFRDNLVIPNNSQTQTVVFVEKTVLKLVFQDLYRQAEQAAEAAKTRAGKIADDTSKEFIAAQADENFLTDVEKELGGALRNSSIPILKSKQKSNPLLVKLALGNVVIVGNEIEYLQRVQIQSSASANASALSAQPASLEFPDQTVALASTAQTVTLTNTSGSPLSNLQFQISGTNKAEFSTGKNTCTSPVAPATSCTVDVMFTPDPTQGVAPPRKASLDVVAGSGSTLVSIPLSGNAKSTQPPPIVFSQTTLTFAAQKAGTGQSSTAKLTIVNLTLTPGGVTIALTPPAGAAGASAADFVATPPANTCGGSLASGANCSITWTFTPTAGASGPRAATATVNVTNTVGGAAVSSQVISLSGTAN